MITLTPFPKDKTGEAASRIFKMPEMGKIWDNQEFQGWAEETALNWSTDVDKDGELFLIREANRVIGITGWYTVSCGDTNYYVLRWHGVIPSKRRQGISRRALSLLYNRLPFTTHTLLQCCFTPDSDAYFRKLGFINLEILGTIPTEDSIKIVSESGGDSVYSLLGTFFCRRSTFNYRTCSAIVTPIPKEVCDTLYDLAHRELVSSRKRLTLRTKSAARRINLDQKVYDEKVLNPLRKEVVKWREVCENLLPFISRLPEYVTELDQ